MSTRDPLAPGSKAPASGQYGIVGPRGGDTGKERTVVKGEPLLQLQDLAKGMLSTIAPRIRAAGDKDTVLI